MKIMLINTQGMYIFPQYLFFSQLPKIKIAFNSYIYKHSDSLCGSGRSEKDEVFCRDLDVEVCVQRLPSTRALRGLPAG